MSRVAIIGIVAAGCSVTMPEPEPTSAAAAFAHDTCTADGISSRRPLTPSGQPFYIEPTTLAASPDGFFLAGAPTYVYESTGKGEIKARDSILGAVFTAGGDVLHLAQWPLPGRGIAGIRAVSAGDGRWMVVFGEMAGLQSYQEADSVVALWFGIFSSRGWDGLQTISFPQDLNPRVFFGSTLTITDRGYAWAIPARVSNGTRPVLLLRIQEDGEATHEVVPTSSSAYAAVISESDGGLMLAVVEPDTSLRQDVNSLFLYRKRDVWRRTRIVAGSQGAVHAPSFTAGDVVSWVTEFEGGFELRATKPPHLQQPIRISHSSITYSAVASPSNRPLWVTQGPGHHADRNEISVVYVSPEDVNVALSMASPYTGFMAAAISRHQLMIAGPFQAISMADPPVTTLLVTGTLKCVSAAHDTMSSSLLENRRE